MLVKRIRQRRPLASRRAGAALVELTVCLPVLVLLVFSSIESCNMIQLKQTLTISSYEGARKAIQYNSTNDAVTAKCNEILTARQVAHAAIAFNPSDVSAVPQGTRINITVSAPCNDNSAYPLNFFAGRTVSVTATMVKE